MFYSTVDGYILPFLFRQFAIVECGSDGDVVREVDEA
jgi:hypothetical protein